MIWHSTDPLTDLTHSPGDKVFYWEKDPSKIKTKGEWIRGKVLSHSGPMVLIETPKQVVRVNQSKVKRDHDEWHDVKLPESLDTPARTRLNTKTSAENTVRPSGGQQVRYHADHRKQDQDYWEAKLGDIWIRHHVVPRSTLF